MSVTLLTFLVTIARCAPRITRNRVNLSFFSSVFMIVVFVEELRAPRWAPYNNRIRNSVKLVYFVGITHTSIHSIEKNIETLKAKSGYYYKKTHVIKPVKQEYFEQNAVSNVTD